MYEDKYGMILYNDHTYKIKRLDKILPLYKKELKDIKIFLIPLLDRPDPIYIPIKPTELLYSTKFEVWFDITILMIDLEADESCNDSIFDTYRVFDNVFDFIQFIFMPFKMNGFNSLYQDMCISTYGFYECGINVCSSHLKINFYNELGQCVTTWETTNKVSSPEEVITGHAQSLAPIRTLLDDFVYVFSPENEFKPITISKHKWSYDKFKDEYHICMYPIDDYNAYYVLTHEDMNAMLYMSRFKIEIVNGYFNLNNLLDEPKAAAFFNKKTLLAEYEESVLDTYNELCVEVYSIESYIHTIPFLYDIITYIEFIDVYYERVLEWKEWKDRKVKSFCILENYKGSSDDKVLFIKSDIYTNYFNNALHHFMKGEEK